jgi:hypothetical protein
VFEHGGRYRALLDDAAAFGKVAEQHREPPVAEYGADTGRMTSWSLTLTPARFSLTLCR